jgi:hypothetical protein
MFLKDTIQEMMEKGFIRLSNSPFGASVLFAKKPDGSLRLCIDYRELNDITLKDKSPLLHLGELRDRVVGANHFSTMDLRDGFYNILLKEEFVLGMVITSSMFYLWDSQIRLQLCRPQ